VNAPRQNLLLPLSARDVKRFKAARKYPQVALMKSWLQSSGGHAVDDFAALTRMDPAV
jgi:hypothetical protein